MPENLHHTVRRTFWMLRGTVLAFLVFVCLISEAEANLYTFRGEENSTYFTNVPGQGRKKVQLTLNATGHLKRSAVRQKRHSKAQNEDIVSSFNPMSRPYDPIILSASEKFAVDPDLVRAVIKAESNFNADAVSRKGAQGLMQIMPRTADELGIIDAFDPEENILGGVRYLRYLLDEFDEDYSLALAAYNAGPSRVAGRNAIPDIAETRDYVKRVLKYFRVMKN